jgi:hypothetical protein
MTTEIEVRFPTETKTVPAYETTAAEYFGNSTLFPAPEKLIAPIDQDGWVFEISHYGWSARAAR